MDIRSSETARIWDGVFATEYKNVIGSNSTPMNCMLHPIN